MENRAYGDRRKQQTEASKGNKNTTQAGLRSATSERVAQTEGHRRFFNLFYPCSSSNQVGKKEAELASPGAGPKMVDQGG